MCSDRPGRVIIVTGPPGAGKTTVARLLTDRLTPSVHMHCDDFWRFIRRGWIAPYLPQAHRQNETVIDVVGRAAFGYAAGGYQVVCDGIVGPWFLDRFRAGGGARAAAGAAARAAARAAGVELHYVVLRPNGAVTLERAAARGGEALTDPEPIQSLHQQFRELGALESHVLDSTGLNPKTTAGLVLRGLDRGAFRLKD